MEVGTSLIFCYHAHMNRWMDEQRVFPIPPFSSVMKANKLLGDQQILILYTSSWEGFVYKLSVTNHLDKKVFANQVQQFLNLEYLGTF